MTKDIEAAVAEYLGRCGIAGACAPSTEMALAQLICAKDATVADFALYLRQLRRPPSGVQWAGWVIGCVRTSFEQFMADRRAAEAMKARAQRAAAEALADAAAKACKRCGGCGIANWEGAVECWAEARHALEFGGELCDCSHGDFWRQMR